MSEGTSSTENKKVRNSSFELLRITAMLAIIIFHFAVYGEFVSDSIISRSWWRLILMGGKWGVNIFVLISGYFLSNDNMPHYNFKRIFKFVGQIVFFQ